jgi:hypothetical protein
MSCHKTEHKADMNPASKLLTPQVQPSKLELSIRPALTEILKKDIEMSGRDPGWIEIAGMEIIPISKKDYFIDERNNQEKNFGRYIQYMEKFKDSHNTIYNAAEIANNKLKHAAVMDYLASMIKKSSSDKEVYKVVYYLKVDSKDLKYNQQQTTYLDEGYKKIVTDYSHLKRSK